MTLSPFLFNKKCLIEAPLKSWLELLTCKKKKGGTLFQFISKKQNKTFQYKQKFVSK